MFYIFKGCISTVTGLLLIKINFILLLIGFLVQIWNITNLKSPSSTFRSISSSFINTDGGLNFVVDLTEPTERHFRNKNTENISCIPPELELWPKDVKILFKDKFRLQCIKTEPNWVFIENGRFMFNNNIVQKHKGISCAGWEIIRNGDFEVKLENKYDIHHGMPIQSDFTEIKCRAETGRMYHNLLSGIKPIKYHNQSYEMMKNNNMEEMKPNIIVIGLDSVSRIHWKRTLPNTYKYFKNNLNGVILEGYNTLGGGTTAALLPLLTGKTEDEIPESRRGFKGAKPIDNLPWIWKFLKELGYVTLWGEDGAASGTFQLRLLGFRDQPVDHHMRPFYLQAERYYKKFKPYCLGSVPRHLNMFNWMKEFVKTYPTKPKFGFIFYSEYSHHGNYEVKILDDDLVDLLKYVAKDENTILLLMSDHGARFQELRRTKQGSLEEKLPFFGLKFPNWLQKRYPKFMENLKKNTKRLTFPFDIHETLLHAVLTEKYQHANTRGQSLFYEIAKDRTCGTIGVREYHCACITWKDINMSNNLSLSNNTINNLVITSANTVIQKINSLTLEFRNYCAFSKLDKIISAKQSVSTKHSYRNEAIIQLVISVLPSKGQFEAIVERHGDKFVVDRFDIIRVNKYGNQADCVAYKYPHLRPFCYCSSE